MAAALYAQGVAPPAQRDDDLRDPRPDRGAHLCRQGRRHARRRCGADGHAGAAFRTPRPYLRRPLHRLARHEYSGGRGPGRDGTGRRACDSAAQGLSGLAERPAYRDRGAAGVRPFAAERLGCSRAGEANRRYRAGAHCLGRARQPAPRGKCRRRGRHRRRRGVARLRSRAAARLCRRPPRRRRAAGRRGALKTVNQRAWFLVLPVFAIVLFSALLPLMTVVNYSVQDSFGNNQFFWNGIGWFQELMDPSSQLGERFFDSLWRNLLFSAIILLIEVPLGIVVALSMPRQGWTVSFCLVVMALPLLIPWNVVGTIWQVFGRGDIGLLGYAVNWLGINYNYTASPLAAWTTIIVMDVWHWTSLVVLLCYAGLKSIPDAYYQAARIDGASRWAVFRTIQLPKMRRVLLIAVLLRFMDSFMIYTEPFVLTGGGPGNATTFLSIDLVKLALGQFDLGKAAAMSLVYNLIILAMCWVFYTVMTNADADLGRRAAVDEPANAAAAGIPPATTVELDRRAA